MEICSFGFVAEQNQTLSFFHSYFDVNRKCFHVTVGLIHSCSFSATVKSWFLL